jgi:hypothetical protein
VRHVEVAGGAIATLTAVRDPADGAVRWRAHLSDGCDGTDAGVRASVDAALAEMRQAFGC